MSKLYFRYGAMNSGKSTAIIQVAYNYEERGHRVLVIKPSIDTKGAGIVSRLGVTRDIDILVPPQMNVYDAVKKAFEETPFACVLVDEAQFLTREQVNQLLEVAVRVNIPVIAYGIRGDFRTNAFPGSARLLELAHTLEEIKTICRCGRKAILNGRKVNGQFVREGDMVAIDGQAVEYESLCALDYMELVGPLP